MHRSASGSLVNEQKTFIDSSATHNNIDTDHQLPTYDPLSDVAKKELSRLRFAENAVHAIPLVLAFCAIVLWFFSNAATLYKWADNLSGSSAFINSICCKVLLALIFGRHCPFC
ncbi:Transmembrane protein [Melia azedarach]|uniref:Transmembrane protein n=1 Tax=Melia azedarach TaxID=155640 RepID=A0ACC1XMM1_MELAZ|nr:Transmembrane protein [Melia azedarach]